MDGDGPCPKESDKDPGSSQAPGSSLANPDGKSTKVTSSRVPQV